LRAGGGGGRRKCDPPPGIDEPKAAALCADETAGVWRVSALGDAAVRLAERGWYVFPLRPGLKTPMYKGGFQRASADPTHVAKFWSQHPSANIGLYPGPSQLLVVDIDPPGRPQLSVSACRL